MNSIARLIRSTMRKRGIVNPGLEVSRVIGIKPQAVSNRFCNRTAFTLQDLAKLEREYDFPAEALKAALHNYKWGEENEDKSS